MQFRKKPPQRFKDSNHNTDLNLSQVSIDIFHIFTTKVWISPIFCIHIIHCKHYIRESLAQILFGRGTARCFHWARRGSINLERERLLKLTAKRNLKSGNKEQIIGTNSKDHLLNSHVIHFLKGKIPSFYI